MAEILIGTSGYYYHEWVGPVYPEGTKPEEYLSRYAGLFPTVELNFSYYNMPKAQNIAKMLEDGGKNLTFAIKAHKTLTHEVNPSLWEREAKTYLTALEPMLAAGRLEAVLFQFPYSFKYSDDNRLYLDKLLKYFHGVPKAVEFRKADWFNGKVIEGMLKREVALTSLDMPELSQLPPSMDVVTAPLSYIRLHGRNKEAWWGEDDHERYNYLYSDSELSAWASRIERIVQQSKRIVVYFNNHPYGKSAKNVQTLTTIFKKIGLMNEGKSGLPS